MAHRISLIWLKKLFKRGKRTLVVLLFLLILVLSLFPLIKKGLLILVYSWEARKETALQYENPFKNHSSFQSFAPKNVDWKFDTRLPLTPKPAYVYQTQTDPLFSLSKNQLAELQKELGFSDKMSLYQLDEIFSWKEGGLSLKLNLGSKSVTFTRSLNLDPELLEKGSFPTDEEAIQKAEEFLSQRLPRLSQIDNTRIQVSHLSFDPQKGVDLTNNPDETSIVFVNFVPLLNDDLVYGSPRYIQFWFAKQNQLVYFEVNPLIFSPYSERGFLKTDREIRKEVEEVGGYLDFTCRNLNNVEKVRLSDFESVFVYNKELKESQPAYRFSAEIVTANDQCQGKFFIPALKDKYYP